jgi:hypothetical protein
MHPQGQSQEQRRIVQAVGGDSAHDRCAVDHGQTFLGPQPEGRETQPLQRGHGVHLLPIEVDGKAAVEPDKSPGDASQRGQVTRGAY